MTRLQIDAADLETALSDNDGQWVLDLRTGEVLMREWARDLARGGPDAGPGAAAWDPDRDDMVDDGFEELDPERFRPIGSIGSHEGFRWMEGFAAAQEDPVVRGRLLDALERRRPFRGFKDALLAFPAVRDAWFAYEAGRLRQEALAWLEAEGIDAEVVDKHPPAAPDARNAPFHETSDGTPP